MATDLRSFYETRKTDVTDDDPRFPKILAAAAALLQSPRSVLDIGCGRGALLERFRQAFPGASLYGVDISQSTVDAARARGFDARVADISQSLPFADAFFECVVFGEVIEHLVDPDAALREISRVLTPNGTLIVTTPNLASWFNRLMLLLGLQPVFTETSLHVNLGRMAPALGQGGPTQGHLKIFTLGALREMLEANGFVIHSISGAPFTQTTKRAVSKLDEVLARFPRFASNFVVAAQKTRAPGTRYRLISENGPVDIKIPPAGAAS